MTNTWLLAFGILSASFLGSWHCTAMCSPIASLATIKNSWKYHAGRLVSYSLIGAIGGLVGQVFLNSSFVALRWISAILFSSVLLLYAVKMFYPHIRTPFFKMKHHPWISHSPLLMGLLTVFLPCGWLWTYTTAAIATQSPYSGALIMALFWLGGLPALATAPVLIRKVLPQMENRKRKVAGGILIVASLYSLGSFMVINL